MSKHVKKRTDLSRLDWKGRLKSLAGNPLLPETVRSAIITALQTIAQQEAALKQLDKTFLQGIAVKAIRASTIDECITAIDTVATFADADVFDDAIAALRELKQPQGETGDPSQGQDGVQLQGDVRAAEPSGRAPSGD